MLREALIGYHAFTASDFMAAFHKMGKIKALKILEKSVETQKAFAALGLTENLDETVIT